MKIPAITNGDIKYTPIPPKPIVVIILKDILPTDTFNKIYKSVEGKLKDYHVLLIDGGEKTDVKVFYEKDFTEVKYEELKEIIEPRKLKLL